MDELVQDGLDDHIRKTTGLIPDAYFSATKIKWILDHVEGAREKARRGEVLFGTVDSWLLWKLTSGAVHVTDCTNASRTMLFDIHKLDWDDTLLDALDIPRAMLPGGARQQRDLRLYRHSGREGAHCGHRRRPAGRPVRPDLLRGGRGKKHLRHRLLPADEHRRHSLVRAKTDW